MEQPDSLARTAAASLIAHEASRVDAAAGADPVAGALQLATLELSRWVGTAGCNALLTRAIDRASQAHPLLRDLNVDNNSVSGLLGLADSAHGDGRSAVGAALNATLVEFFELLVRLVGEELTMKLAEQITGRDTVGDALSDDQKENA